MKNLYIVVVLSIMLAGCAPKSFLGWSGDHWKNQDFKPYIESQQAAQPASNTAQPWLYLPGTEPAAVAQQLASSQIITKVRKSTRLSPKKHRMLVVVGKNFYKLSPGDQRQVMALTDEMYKLSENPEMPVFLQDATTKQIIGQYADKNLMVY